MQQLNNLTFDDGPEATTQVIEVEERPARTHTETVWRYVRDNPGCKAAEITAGCPGLKYDAVSTRLNQLYKRGYLSKEGRYPTMFTVTDRLYESVTAEDRVANLLHARSLRKSLGRPKKAKAAPVPQVAKPVKAVTPTVQVTPVDLNTLSIVQARKLYDELKQIFGA